MFLSQSPNHQARLNKQAQKSLVTKPILSDNLVIEVRLTLLI